MRGRILIVEDNTLNCILLTDILTINDYEVFSVNNGSEVMETVARVNPDLILMDIQMPEMDGITATKLLKSDSRTKDIPVVAVSSYAFEKEKELFLSAGGNEYLTKPINIDEVLTVVDGFLKKES